jgi:protoporphyrinogen oxidase
MGARKRGDGLLDTAADTVDAIVIGAGFTGLSAAAALRECGQSVQVLEAADVPGGLARSIAISGVPIEAHYHHVFPNDVDLLGLIARFGLTERLEWHHARMGVVRGGATYDFDSLADLLRFSPLPFADRLRAALGTSSLLLEPRRTVLARTTAARLSRARLGRLAHEALWEPLLVAKFGVANADSVSADWLVARLRQRARARRVHGDRLGYLRGGLQTLLTTQLRALQADGVAIALASPVSRIRRDGETWLVDVSAPASHPATRRLRAGVVVAAIAGPILADLVALPTTYASLLTSVPFRAVVSALMVMDRSLGAHYWVNVTDAPGLQPVAVIEHTNLVPGRLYGDRTLVYFTHYVDEADPLWSASAEALVAGALPTLRAIRPSFDVAWIREVHVSRDRFAQPVPLIGLPLPLSVRTGLPGLYHASLTHIHPDDRGVSRAIRLGDDAGRLAAARR